MECRNLVATEIADQKVFLKQPMNARVVVVGSRREQEGRQGQAVLFLDFRIMWAPSHIDLDAHVVMRLCEVTLHLPLDLHLRLWMGYLARLRKTLRLRQ